MSTYKFLVVWGFGFSQLWCHVTMLMFPNVWRNAVPSSSTVEGPHHQKEKKNLNRQQWPYENLKTYKLFINFPNLFPHSCSETLCAWVKERYNGMALSSFVSKHVWQTVPSLFVVDRLAFSVVIQANISSSKVTKN